MHRVGLVCLRWFCFIWFSLTLVGVLISFSDVVKFWSLLLVVCPGFCWVYVVRFSGGCVGVLRCGEF